MSRGKVTKQTLCWDCKNSTKPDICPWVRDFTPVPGWTAEKTEIRNLGESYLVKECPLFKRGAFKGGMEEDVFGKREHISIDNQDTVKLAEAIIERYVEDWKFLEYGELDGIRFCGSRLKRKKILEFFYSEWFERLLSLFSDIEPDYIRKALKIKVVNK